MDSRTQRELAELKELRYHLQRQKELPQKIEQAESAMKRSASQWESAMERKAKMQAQNELSGEKPVKKPTDHEEKVGREIREKIHREWSKKDDIHTGVYNFLKVTAVIVSIVILLGIHGYMGWQVYNQNYPEFLPSFTLHPNYYEDIATSQYNYNMFAVGQVIISLGINGVLCYAVNQFGGKKKT